MFGPPEVIHFPVRKFPMFMIYISFADDRASTLSPFIYN